MKPIQSNFYVSPQHLSNGVFSYMERRDCLVNMVEIGLQFARSDGGDGGILRCVVGKS